MTFCFRPSPLLQETRILTVSSDNGLVTPLPMPLSDLWDINSVPGAGLTLEYTISNISQYQGRIIYINKTQDTTGSTIELTLPGGYVFSSSGTSTLLFPDEPATLALVFSASPIVSVMSGVGGGGISVSPRQSSARINVDPTSNQDPTTNGLLLPAGTTEFTMPITVVDQGLGIGNPYVDDPNGDYTIGSDNLEINNALDCRVSIMIAAVGSVAKTAPLVVQVLLQGETIFTSPPLCSAATMAGLDVGPFGPYTKAWFLSGTANAKIAAGDILIVRILPNNPTDDNVITLTSNISICRIDDQGIVGPQGPPGPTPDAFENGVFQAALNPGINFTNLDCSPSAFGASVTQTINAVPINYQVTDTNISNNTISRINDAGSTSVVDCTSSDIGVFTTDGSIIIEATKTAPGLGFQLIATGTGATGTVHADGTLDITSGDTAQMNITGDLGISATQNLDIFATNGTYTAGSTNSTADLYGLTKSSITSDTLCEIWALSGDARIRTLTNINSPDQYVSRISSTGQLFNSSVPYSRRATITDVVVPIGTADGIVYASLIYVPTGIYGRVGDIIEFTFSSIAGFDDVGSETDLFIGGHLIPSIGGGVNLLKITACLTSLVGPTYKYTVTYNNTTSGTTRLATGSFVGPAILSGLGAYLRTASFPATTVAITIDFGFLQLNRLNQAT